MQEEYKNFWSFIVMAVGLFMLLAGSADVAYYSGNIMIPIFGAAILAAWYYFQK